MRGKDNFVNPYQYLMEQILIYNYSIQSEFDIIKQKIWVLDGELTDQDKNNGYVDNDYNNPLNHYGWLSRELEFLEYYKESKEGNSTEFNDKKEYSINVKNEYLERINSETGNLYKDYEIPYSVRPTYLSDDEFQILYEKLEEKIQQSPTIITKAQDLLPTVTTSIPLDSMIISLTNGVNSALSPDEITSNSISAAYKLKTDKDDIYVEQLNSMWSELWDIVKSLKENAEELIPEKPDDNSIEWDNEALCVWNWPQLRVKVNPEDSSTFYGMNNDPEYPLVKGYHYFVWDMKTDNINSDVSYATISAINDGSAWLPSVTYSSSNYPMIQANEEQLLQIHGSAPLHYLLQPNLDWNGFIFFFIGYYYEETQNNMSGESTIQLKTKNLKVLLDMSNLPLEDGSEEIKNSKTWNRFAQLHKNWIVINNLRENIMNGIGTRSQIEIMSSLSNPMDSRSFLVNNLNATINQKDVTTQYLKNTTSEFK